MSLSKEGIKKLQVELTNTIEKYIESEDRIAAFQKFFDRYGERFFTAPASYSEKFHDCFMGGLAFHTFKVMNNLLKLANTLDRKRYSNEILVSAAFLHDVGKIGDRETDFYTPQEEEWRISKGQLYTLNFECMPMNHEIRSIMIANDCGFNLTNEEYQAIVGHGGPYSAMTEHIKMQEYPLTILLFFADRWALQESINKSIHKFKE